MKKIATVVFLLLASLLARAQEFDYNVGFDYLFNNYEHGQCRYTVGEESFYPYQYSHTLHGVRLTPEAGLLVRQSPSVFHRLRIGVDVFKQMGEEVENLGLFREIILYYNVEALFPEGRRLEAYAGCFPRRFCSGTGYYGPVFDSEYAWLDPNLEGVLVKYSVDRRLRAEIALDWQGMVGDAFSPLRRERFRIISDGQWRFAGDFSLGWTASIYHFSKSPTSNNVVDSDLFNPRIIWEPFTWLDSVRLELGGIFTYQLDRKSGWGPVFPMGLWSSQSAGKWDVTVANRFYWGDDLMPFYGWSFAGIPYGRDLYPAAAGFKTLRGTPSWADWLTVSYQPRIARWLSLDVAVTVHFGQPAPALGAGFFRGCDQRIGLRVDLEPLRPQPKAPKKHKKPGINL
ncbi:MAG: hypothetical protein J6X71_08885 [Bacteroidales bacterium]|nr:hypothetical protein [Bacteroidales bacterium]